MKIFAPGEEMWTSQDRHGCFVVIVLREMQVSFPPLIHSGIVVAGGDECELFVVQSW